MARLQASLRDPALRQRIARGRTGPNIQSVGLMGTTLQQMRLLVP